MSRCPELPELFTINKIYCDSLTPSKAEDRFHPAPVDRHSTKHCIKAIKIFCCARDIALNKVWRCAQASAKFISFDHKLLEHHVAVYDTVCPALCLTRRIYYP